MSNSAHCPPPPPHLPPIALPIAQACVTPLYAKALENLTPLTSLKGRCKSSFAGGNTNSRDQKLSTSEWVTCQTGDDYGRSLVLTCGVKNNHSSSLAILMLLICMCATRNQLKKRHLPSIVPFSFVFFIFLFDKEWQRMRDKICSLKLRICVCMLHAVLFNLAGK